MPDGAAAPLANARIRDALGYRAWVPPVATHDASDSGGATVGTGFGWRTRIARRALAMRGTPFGRLLYRMTPSPVIDALKARLHG